MAKIFVVDDEVGICDILEVFLKRNGHEVTVSSDALEALEIIKKDGSFDLLILDHRMPKMEGGAVIQNIREMGNKTPVLLLTGSVGMEVQGLGADAVLMKPVDLNMLLEKVEELLGKNG